MESLLTLWREGGPTEYVVLLLFLVAFVMLSMQLVLARRGVVFPGLCLGWATSILACAMVGMAVGYGLILDVSLLRTPVELQRGLACKATEQVLLHPFFALGAVAILLALQLLADGLTHRDLAGSSAPGRAVRIVAGLALLGLVAAGLFNLRVIMSVHRSVAQQGLVVGDLTDVLHGQLRMGLAAGLASLVLGVITITLSVHSGVRRFGARAAGNRATLGS